ncbi:MAG TPA: hypothetical protein VKV06_07715 [Acidimicrobiales bacterium]|nr:hypothetical protein [Acidimicrobiales bacterium]
MPHLEQAGTVVLRGIGALSPFTTTAGGPWVEVAPALYHPETTSYRLDLGTWHVEVGFWASWLAVTWDRADVRGEDLEAEALRVFPWAALRQVAVSRWLRVGAEELRPVKGLTDEDRRRFADLRPTSKELLAEVAHVYWVAHLTGQPPTATVATEFGLKPATASRRVAAAREAGYLPPAHQGKAG